MSTVGSTPKPPLSDMEGWLNFWYYTRGQNVIPMIPKLKTARKGYNWRDYERKRVPEDVFAKWKSEGAFRDGFGVILGKSYEGANVGEYLTLIDLDNLLAIEQFCLHGDKLSTLKDLSSKFIIEQHNDNLNKAHVVFYSKKPFTSKASDASKVDDFKRKVAENLIPSFEIKAVGSDGVFFATPSLHQNGEHYDILGTLDPVTLSEAQADGMMKHIDAICERYGLHYLSNAKTTDPFTGESKSGIPRESLFDPDYVTTEGNNRHQRHLLMFDSLIHHLYKKEGQSLEKVKVVAKTFACVVCQPPKSEEQFEKDWADACDFMLKEDERKKNEELLEGCEMMEQICRSPETYAAVIKKNDYRNPTTSAIQKIRAIETIVIARKKDKESGQISIEHQYKDIILNAAPTVPIEIIKDPLFGHVKYRLRFEYVSAGGEILQTEPIGPYTKEELKDYLLKKTTWVYKNRLLEDALSQVLKGYEARKGMAKRIEEIEPEGFFYYNGKIVASKLPHLSIITTAEEQQFLENNRKALQAIIDLQRKFFKSARDKARLAHYIKLFLIAPFDYVRKQMGIAQHGNNWVPRGDLCGEGGTGKTEFGRLACYMWGLNPDTHILPKRAIDSEARITNTLATSTMVLTFEEPDFLTHHKNKPATESILSMLKNTVDQLEGYRMTQHHQRIPEPYLAHFIMTHNSNPVTEEGAIRRFVIDTFRSSDKKDTKKNKELVAEYNRFIEENRENFINIGRFVYRYIVVQNHQEVLKMNWQNAAKKLILNLYMEATTLPSEASLLDDIEWLMDGGIESVTDGGSGFSSADLDDQRRELLRSALAGYISDTWTRNRNEYEQEMIQDYKEEQRVKGGYIDSFYKPAKPGIFNISKWLVTGNKLRGFSFHPKYGICMTTAVMEALNRYGLSSDDRIKHSDLEDLCGFKVLPVKLNSKTTRVATATVEDFTDFIAPVVEEGDNNSNTPSKQGTSN